MTKLARTPCPVPPAIGAGKTWRFLVHEWTRVNPNNPKETNSETLFIPHGMPVHEKSHEAYWEARKAASIGIGAYRAAGVGPGYVYVVTNDADVIVGIGEFPPEYDIDDIAWFVCMFLERRLRVHFIPPRSDTPPPPTSGSA